MIFIRLLSYLPFPVIYLISDFTAFLAYRIIRYRKKVVFKNLRNSFPEKTEKEIRKIAREFYTHLADITLETFKAIDMSADEFRRRVSLKNEQIAFNYYSQNKPIIVLTSHQGNWEWMLLANSLMLPYPVDAVYKKIKSDSFDKLMKQIRGKFGPTLIEKDKILRETVKKKNEVRLIAMVADQTPSKAKDRNWFHFLNRETAFYTGGEKLARSLNYPVLFVYMHRIKRGYYEVVFQDLGEPSAESAENSITESYVKLLEEAIRKYPSEWLWSHKRWKHKKL
jgi:Kdo2-lipid IVA lauroyltransferase/acyltransferase